MQLRIQRLIPRGSPWFQLCALVSSSPPAPKDFSLIAAPRRDCSLQLPHAKLECFSAGSSWAGSKGGWGNEYLGICKSLFPLQMSRGPSSVPSSALQLQNLVLPHARDVSLAPCPGIKLALFQLGYSPVLDAHLHCKFKFVFLSHPRLSLQIDIDIHKIPKNNCPATCGRSGQALFRDYIFQLTYSTLVFQLHA